MIEEEKIERRKEQKRRAARKAYRKKILAKSGYGPVKYRKGGEKLTRAEISKRAREAKKEEMKRDKEKIKKLKKELKARKAHENSMVTTFNEQQRRFFDQNGLLNVPPSPGPPPAQKKDY